MTWAIGQLRREHATIQGLSRQLEMTWKTLWRAVLPRLVNLAADEARLAGVATLGVDEHVWHHTLSAYDLTCWSVYDLTGALDGQVA